MLDSALQLPSASTAFQSHSQQDEDLQSSYLVNIIIFHVHPRSSFLEVFYYNVVLITQNFCPCNDVTLCNFLFKSFQQIDRQIALYVQIYILISIASTSCSIINQITDSLLWDCKISGRWLEFFLSLSLQCSAHMNQDVQLNPEVLNTFVYVLSSSFRKLLKHKQELQWQRTIFAFEYRPPASAQTPFQSLTNLQNNFLAEC